MLNGGMSCKLIGRWRENGREQTAERTFDQDNITIGRGVGNTFILKDPTRYVGRNHAEIRKRQGVWSIWDSGSINGTILNGTKLVSKQEHELHDGDELAIGKYRLVFKAVAPRDRGNGSGDASSVGQVYTDLGVLDFANDSDPKAKYIAAVFSAVCGGLAVAIRGRREFQREFEVELPRFAAGMPNPIKDADNASEIETILLNPASCQLSEGQAIECLQEVFQDLVFHQLGLMVGLREGIRGVLKEFDPAVVKGGASDEFKEKGLALLGGKKDRADAAAWQRYVNKYRRMTDEEVKCFERVVAPYLAKGYLSVQKSRKRS